MKQPMVDTMLREKFDDLYTPQSAILPLVKYLPPDPRTAWECCDPGGSVITRVLQEQLMYRVLSSDLKTGLDFLTCRLTDPFDLIITNPPYSLKDQFLRQCYSYQKPFALLLPLTSLEGIKRGEMFAMYGISVIVLARRTDFTGKKSNWFNVSWFTWGILPPNTLIFEDQGAI